MSAPTTEAQYAAAVDALLRCRGDRAEIENTLTQARILGGQYLARAEKAEATIARVEALADEILAEHQHERALGKGGAHPSMQQAHLHRATMATNIERRLRAALRGPEPTERPHLCRHGKTAEEHWCDDHGDRAKSGPAPTEEPS